MSETVAEGVSRPDYHSSRRKAKRTDTRTDDRQNAVRICEEKQGHGVCNPVQQTAAVQTYGSMLYRHDDSHGAQISRVDRVHLRENLGNTLHLPLLIFPFFVLCFCEATMVSKMEIMESSLEYRSCATRPAGCSRICPYTPGKLPSNRRVGREPSTSSHGIKSQICGFLDRAGLQKRLEERPVVFLIGAGTSDYIGQGLALLLRQAWKCEVIGLRQHRAASESR